MTNVANLEQEREKRRAKSEPPVSSTEAICLQLSAKLKKHATDEMAALVLREYPKAAYMDPVDLAGVVRRATATTLEEIARQLRGNGDKCQA